MTTATTPTLFALDGKVPAGATRFHTDSIYVPHFVEHLFSSNTEAHDALYQRLHDQLPWLDPHISEMRYRGNPLRRTKCFMVQTTFDAAETADRTNNPSTPIYTYPGFQYESVLHYVDIDDVPLVAHIVRQITARCTFAGAPIVLNHAIGTRYDDGEKMIGFHSDKVHDIAADTPILMLSFGGRRELHWRRAEAPNDFVESFVMEPGSLFVLGWQTNLALQHSIVPAADERVLDRAVEPVAPRISLVLRHIATAMTHDALLRQIERSRRGKTKRADNKQSKQQQSKQQHNKKQQSKKRTASEIVE